MFTVHADLMKCIYCPYGDNGVCGVTEVYLFTVPAGLMECIYRSCGAAVVCLPYLRG